MVERTAIDRRRFHEFVALSSREVEKSWCYGSECRIEETGSSRGAEAGLRQNKRQRVTESWVLWYFRG